MRAALILILAALVVWGAFRIADLERQRYALSTGLCAAFDPACLAAVQPRTSWAWNLYYGLIE
jgi:hypothetical protein